FADATDGPIERTGWLLHHIGFRNAIPRDRPAHSPAMTGTHRTTVLEINATVRQHAIVEQHAGAPAHVAFYVAVAAKSAVQKDIRPGMPAAGRGEPNIICIHGTMIEKYLIAIRGKLRWLGGALMQRFAIYRHVLQRNAASAEAHTVHRFINDDIAHPT